MTRSSASLFRLRSLIGATAVAVVLGSVGAPAPARAETPDGAPSTAPASAPDDAVPLDEPTAPVAATPASDGTVAVSAVVVDGQGADVVTVEVAPAAVARTRAELGSEPGVVSVS